MESDIEKLNNLKLHESIKITNPIISWVITKVIGGFIYKENNFNYKNPTTPVFVKDIYELNETSCKTFIPKDNDTSVTKYQFYNKES